MNCNRCGSNVPAGSPYCPACGQPVSGAPPVVAQAPVVYQGPAQTSGKAIASLVFGFLFFFLPAAIVAIVLGHISLSEIKKSAGRLEGQGLAIGGLILGYLGVAAIPLILIIAAIAIPNILRARMAANEGLAAATLRSINTAEGTYYSGDGKGSYACDLETLEKAGLLRKDQGIRNGYIFSVHMCSAAADGEPAKYQILAKPVNSNVTGRRILCSDESAVIKSDEGGSAENCFEHGTPLQ